MIHYQLQLTCVLSVLGLLACGGGDEDTHGGVPLGSGGSMGAGAATTGGSVSSGGSFESGGAAMSSGGSAAGGQNTGGTTSDTGGSAGSSGGAASQVECTITVTSGMPSPDMGSVGVVELTTDLAGITQGTIDFGATTDYGMQAPVDVETDGMRTLLLGLPFGSELHYRITLQAGNQTCSSDDQTMTLGAAPPGLDAAVTFDAPGGGATEKGYILSVLYQPGTVFITNFEGELVWAKNASVGQLSQARMSYDAKYIYARNGNPNGTAGGFGGPGGGGGGQIVRLSLDGSMEETISAPTSHHDLTFLPNGNMVYLRRSEDVTNCDVVVERTFDGQETVLYEFADAFPSFSRGGNQDGCHVNAIRYSEDDQTLMLSSLSLDSMININLDGTLNWVIGGMDATLDMNGLTWDRQHGMHLIDSSSLYFFNNGGNSEHGDGNSVALKLAIGADAITVDPWFYDSNNSTNSQGDLQVLPNGNVLVTYSNDGVSHEVDDMGTKVRTIEYAQAVGYANYRTSLYGPPLH